MQTYSEKLVEKGKSWETTITPSKPWLRQGVDLEWLKKEYRKMLEFFKESPAYHWMTEDARADGLAQGREQGLAAFRQTVVRPIDERFPRLAELACWQVQGVKDLERLQQAILRVSLSKDAAEAADALAELEEETDQPGQVSEERH